MNWSLDHLFKESLEKFTAPPVSKLSYSFACAAKLLISKYAFRAATTTLPPPLSLSMRPPNDDAPSPEELSSNTSSKPSNAGTTILSLTSSINASK